MMGLSQDWPILGIEIDEWLGFISGENWESVPSRPSTSFRISSAGSYAGKSGSTC
jgi:hypothetical protein